jgi:hypothetical protein
MGLMVGWRGVLVSGLRGSEFLLVRVALGGARGATRPTILGYRAEALPAGTRPTVSALSSEGGASRSQVLAPRLEQLWR